MARIKSKAPIITGRWRRSSSGRLPGRSSTIGVPSVPSPLAPRPSPLPIPVHDGMADELHAQLRHALRIPFLLEREDAQDQVVVARHLVGAALARGPDLGRDVLDDLGVPVVEPVGVRASVLPDGMGKAAVEPGEIHADDRVGLALQRELEELVEQPAELEIVLQHLRQANHRMRGHVEGQVHSRSGHVRAARAEEARLQAGVQRLVIRRRNRFRLRELLAQGAHEFRRQHVPAGLARDQHEALWVSRGSSPSLNLPR